MSITNLLARGFDPMPAGGQAQALMQVQQLRAGQQRNLLLQQQMQAAQAEQALAQRNALLGQQWRDGLEVPQGTTTQVPGMPAMNAAQAESAVGSPGYGASSAQDRTEFVPPDPRQVAAVKMAKANMMSPMDLFKIQNPERKLTSVKEGETLVDERTLTPVFSGAPKADKPPSAVQEYQFAVGQGYKGTFEQWDTARKRAGATTLSVNTAKPLMNEVAGGLGKQIDATLAGAKAATGAIETAKTLMQAVDSGKVVAGPGASFRVFGLQLGQMLGVGGKDGAETLANTRTAIQAMAQSELDAAQQMKGQGQITEAERDIIRRAASGNIDGMTAPEIRLLASTMDKMARVKIKSHNSNLDALKRMPEAAPLLPFYTVNEPPAYSPQSGGGVRKYNPATGKIE